MILSVRGRIEMLAFPQLSKRETERAICFYADLLSVLLLLALPKNMSFLLELCILRQTKNIFLDFFQSNSNQFELNFFLKTMVLFSKNQNFSPLLK